MKGVSSCGAPGEAASTSRGQWRDNEAIRRGRDVRRVDTHHPPLKGTNITWQSVSLMRDWREQKKSDAALVVRVSTLRKMCTTTEEEEKRNKKKQTKRQRLGRRLDDNVQCDKTNRNSMRPSGAILARQRPTGGKRQMDGLAPRTSNCSARRHSRTRWINQSIDYRFPKCV